MEPTATSTPTPAAPDPTPTPTQEPDSEPEDDPAALADLRAKLDAVVAGVDGTVAISVAAADGTFLYGLNEHETMEAASIYKLAVMVEIFRQRELGVLTFDDPVVLADAYFNEGPDTYGWGDVGAAATVESLLFAMITQSSNVASYALLDLAGTDNVNATMLDLGLSGVEIRWSPGYRVPPPYVPDPEEPAEEPAEEEPVEEEPVDEEPVDQEPVEEEPVEEEPADEEAPEPEEEDAGIGAPGPVSMAAKATWLSAGGPQVLGTLRADGAFNVVTAADIAQLLVLMLNGEVVSSDASREMLDLLAQQQIFGGLTMLVPEGTVAHKTGYLPDGVINDAGVVYTNGGPFVAVVFTEHVREDIAYRIAGEVALLLYEFGS